MAKIKTLREADGTKVYPVTVTDAVKTETGASLSSVLTGLNSSVAALSEEKETIITYTQVGENIAGGASFTEIKSIYQRGGRLSARIMKNDVQISGNLAFFSFDNSKVVFVGVRTDFTLTILTHAKNNTITLATGTLPYADASTSGIIRLGTAEADSSINVIQGQDNIPRVSKAGLDSYLSGYLGDYLKSYIPENTVKTYASTSEPTASDGKIGDIWVVVEA